MKATRFLTAAVVLLLMLSVVRLEAVEYNYRNVLVGSRAAMLGGAYTALADDLSAAYYNPAGLAFAEKLIVSVDGAVYGYHISSERGMIVDQNFDQYNIYPYKLNSTSYQGSPTLFGIGTKIGDRVGLAVSFVTTDFMKFNDMELSFIVADDEPSILVYRNSYEYRNDLVGPTLAVKLADSVALGVSVFYQIASYRSDTQQFIRSFSPTFGFASNESALFSGGGLVVAPGFKWHITPELKLGVLYSTETFHIVGKEKFMAIDLDYDTAAGTQESDIFYVRDNGRYKHPHRIAAGLAYERQGVFTVSLDGIYYFPLRYGKKYTFLDRKAFREKAHYDLSLGMELFMTKNLSLRMGAFTNSSSAPERLDVMNIYGGALGVGIHGAKGFSSGLGITVSHGAQKGSKAKFDALSESLTWHRVNNRRIAVAFMSGASKQF